MSVDDLVYKMFNPESCEFVINGITYGKQSDIPNNVLSKNVSNWEILPNTLFDYLFCIGIDTWDEVHIKISKHIMNIGFSSEQLRQMIKSGISLSTITDMALSIEAVIEAYTKLGYNKHQVRPIIYELYANELLMDVNEVILGFK